MASSTEVLAGLVDRVTFHNSETGFCVLRPSDQCGSASVVQRHDALNPFAGDGQLRANESAGHTVKHQMLGVFAHPGRNSL